MARQLMVGSDEHFLENWLQFASFHRARIATVSARRIETEADDAFAASHMITVINECVQAFEDMGLWSAAIRRYQSSPKATLVECLDGAQLNWREFWPRLSSATVGQYIDLYGLKTIDSVREPERAAYESAVRAWATEAGSLAAALADGVDGTTGDRPVLYWILNKIKHGLLVSAVRYEGALQVIFRPIVVTPNNREMWAQEVNAAASERFATLTYKISKILAVTLAQFFCFQFGREPAVRWRTSTDQHQGSLDEIISAISVPDLPSTSVAHK